MNVLPRKSERIGKKGFTGMGKGRGNGVPPVIRRFERKRKSTTTAKTGMPRGELFKVGGKRPKLAKIQKRRCRSGGGRGLGEAVVRGFPRPKRSSWAKRGREVGKGGETPGGGRDVGSLVGRGGRKGAWKYWGGGVYLKNTHEGLGKMKKSEPFYHLS